MSLVRPEPLPQRWFERHPVEVAFDLVGCLIVVERDGVRVIARITETEAYGGDEDLASHATVYRVGRQTLLHEAGILYMQQSYGIHTMTNIVAHRPGELGAALLRSAEDPLEGIERAKEAFPKKRERFLVGPGNVSRGAGTRLDDTLKPLTRDTGVYVSASRSKCSVFAGPRIGISRSVHARWRFFDAESRCVSRHKRGELVTRDDLESIRLDLFAPSDTTASND